MLTISQRYKLRQFIWLSSIGLVGGFLYTLIEDGWVIAPLINGTSAGFMVGVMVALLELYVFPGNLRKISFARFFILRVGVYFILAFFITFSVFLVSRMIRFDLGVYGVLQSEEFQDYLLNRYYLVLIVCFLVIVLCVFTLQMSRKLGFMNMVALISGKYRTPRKENMIIMFISLGRIDDIVATTGNMGYHNYINDFIHDITDTIRIHKGTIIQYMEDEIIVAWNFKEGISNANCIRAYFYLRNEIEVRLEYYHTKYGLQPKPVCAINAGTVIQAEIGEIKSEISLFGDVINSTSRILHEGIKQQVDILVSQSVLDLLQIPVFYKVQPHGTFIPRGKQNPIQLCSLYLDHE